MTDTAKIEAPADATPPKPKYVPKYVIDGIIPKEEVSILSGASGVGKTTLLMQMIAAIQSGETQFFGHEIQYPVRIAYIAADRSWESYCELAERVGVDVSQLQVRAVVDDQNIDVNLLETDPMRLLFNLITAFDKPTLVIVDPLIVFLGCDTNRYNQVAPRLIKINRWCRSNAFSLLGTHHATKARSDYTFKRAQDRVSGSSAILGFTSTQLFLAGADELGKPYSEWAIVPHNRPAEGIKLGRNDRGLLTRWEDASVNPAFVTAVLSVTQKFTSVTKTVLQRETKIDPATLDAVLTHLVTADMLVANARGEFRRPSGDGIRH